MYYTDHYSGWLKRKQRRQAFKGFMYASAAMFWGSVFLTAAGAM